MGDGRPKRWPAEKDESQCGREVESVEHFHCSSDTPPIWIAEQRQSSLPAGKKSRADGVTYRMHWEAGLTKLKMEPHIAGKAERSWSRQLSKLAIANLQPTDWVTESRKRKQSLLKSLSDTDENGVDEPDGRNATAYTMFRRAGGAIASQNSELL